MDDDDNEQARKGKTDSDLKEEIKIMVSEFGDIMEDMKKHASLTQCPKCKRYLEGRKSWINIQFGSDRLLSLCVKRLTTSLCKNDLVLVGAEFVGKEPTTEFFGTETSLNVKLTVHKTFCNGLTIEKMHVVEYSIQDKLCKLCSS